MLQVLARCDLRHHAAERLVPLDLRGDEIDAHAAVALEQRDRGFIAGGFDSENHGHQPLTRPPATLSPRGGERGWGGGAHSIIRASLMKEELAKRYEPKDFEQRIYADWEKGQYFTPVVDKDRPKFSIVIPPPNVTGRLHIGHALVNTLQDIIVRWKRMSGFNTLWVPGTDHAGIATQMVVEREIAKEGLSRFELGRDKFVERIWQ